MWPPMQPMKDAPRNRRILIKLSDAYKDANLGANFIVAHYAQWDPTGPYQEVWEIEAGECFKLNDKDLVGWWDLPEG